MANPTTEELLNDMFSDADSSEIVDDTEAVETVEEVEPETVVEAEAETPVEDIADVPELAEESEEVSVDEIEEVESTAESVEPARPKVSDSDLITLVVNGKTDNVPLSEVVRRAQLFDASSQAMRESAQLRKTAETFNADETQQMLSFARNFADNWGDDPIETLSAFAESEGIDKRKLIQRLTASAVADGTIDGVAEHERATLSAQHREAVAKRDQARAERQQQAQPVAETETELDQFGWAVTDVLPVYQGIWEELGLNSDTAEAAATRKEVVSAIEDLRWSAPDANPSHAYRQWLVNQRGAAGNAANPVKQAIAESTPRPSKAAPKPPGSGAPSGAAPSSMSVDQRANKRTLSLLDSMGFE